jgi:hypothetical protein
LCWREGRRGRSKSRVLESEVGDERRVARA